MGVGGVCVPYCKGQLLSLWKQRSLTSPSGKGQVQSLNLSDLLFFLEQEVGEVHEGCKL